MTCLQFYKYNMTEYVIDIIVENVWHSTGWRGQESTFYIKIDTRGNVDIKQRNTYLQSGHHNTIGPIWDVVTMNDNIPIPSYMIDVIKNSFCKPTATCRFGSNCGDQLFLHHYLNAIENIIILKENLAKGHETLIDLI